MAFGSGERSLSCYESERTQLVSFSGQRRNKLELKLFSQTISEKDELVMLGVTFGRNGSLRNHCKGKASKAMQRVQLLRLVSGQSWGANARTLLTLYKQYIRPVLEYGNVVTCEAGKTYLNQLQVVQNAALRTALRAPKWTKISDLHERARIVPLADRLRSLQCKAMQRYGD